MSGFRAWLYWAALAIAVAAIVYVASVHAVPGLVMSRALSMMGTPNTIHHAGRVTETSRAVVRPSPDLLYSTCPFDLSAGPLRVRSAVPPGTYWSVSAFDAGTGNFFVLNDKQAGNGVVDFLIVQRGTKPNTKGFKVVVSPPRRGLVLFRTLIASEKQLPALDALRREATCATFHARPSDVSGRH